MSWASARTRVEECGVLVDVARGTAIERLVWTMLVEPSCVRRQLLPHCTQAKRNDQAPEPLILERLDKPFNHRNAAILIQACCPKSRSHTREGLRASGIDVILNLQETQRAQRALGYHGSVGGILVEAVYAA